MWEYRQTETVLSNKDEKQAESRMWWGRQKLFQDVSLTLQPRLASKDNAMHLCLFYDHRSYLSGAILHGDVCFPPHPKLLDTPSLSSLKKAQGGDQNEPGALGVERMPKSQKAKTQNISPPKVLLASPSPPCCTTHRK